MQRSVAKNAVRLALMLALAGLATYAIWPKPAAPKVVFQIIGEGRVPLQSLRGKPVLVLFWATTCPTCVEEMPQLAALYAKHHARGFELIAVAMPEDRPDRVYQFVQSHALPFKVALDIDGQVLRAFGDVPGTPTAFVIDRAGRVTGKRSGRLDFQRLDAWLARSQ